MNYTFAEFLKLDRDTQIALGNIINEELKPAVKKRKMRELEKLLKVHDFLYDFMDGDYREWKRQHEMAQDIRKLRDLIGTDAELLYKQYAKKGGCWEGNNSPTPEKVNEVKERQSIFPEQNVSQKNIQLGYGEGTVLPNGGHHFANDPWDTTTKWEAPSDARKKRMRK